MAVKVGNSFVSEAAYAHAKAQQLRREESETLSQLSKRFPQTDFSVNTAPFQGKGTNNIAISPNILRQMEQDPEKRLEYEALIYDCTNHQKSMGAQYAASGKELAAQGFIIDSGGGLSSWSISRSGSSQQRSRNLLSKNNKTSWAAQIMGKPACKPSLSMLPDKSKQPKKAGGLASRA